jgi:hypothetical protein
MSKDKINKSQKIRELLDQNPHIQAKEVVEQLGKQGILIKPSLVYMIKGRLVQMKSQKGKRAARLSRNGDKTGSADPIALILKVKALAEEAGGMKKLKALITVLAD